MDGSDGRRSPDPGGPLVARDGRGERVSLRGALARRAHGHREQSVRHDHRYRPIPSCAAAAAPGETLRVEFRRRAPLLDRSLERPERPGGELHRHPARDRRRHEGAGDAERGASRRMGGGLLPGQRRGRKAGRRRFAAAGLGPRARSRLRRFRDGSRHRARIRAAAGERGDERFARDHARADSLRHRDSDGSVRRRPALRARSRDRHAEAPQGGRSRAGSPRRRHDLLDRLLQPGESRR